MAARKEVPMVQEDKLIDYLSKEIETHTNNRMTFRARINLAVFLGPFVLLGSFLAGAKGVPRGIAIDGWTVAACVGLGISYIVMGMVSAAIEDHMWRQCNAWRRLIAIVVSDSSTKISQEDLIFTESVRLGYAVVYLAMILAFVCATLIISRIDVLPSP